MTKRFTTKNIICSNYCVWDNDDKPYGNDEVVDLLNEQHEEIQQSKVLIKKYHNENTDLIKENEQLKSELRNLRRLANEIYMEGSE